MALTLYEIIREEFKSQLEEFKEKDVQGALVLSLVIAGIVAAVSSAYHLDDSKSYHRASVQCQSQFYIIPH